MRSYARIAFLAPLIGALLAVSAPAAQAAFGVESFFSANCKTTTCTAKSTEEHPSEFFTQAAGHPLAGITDFTIKHRERTDPPFPVAALVPEGNVKTIRTDVAPGVS